MLLRKSLLSLVFCCAAPLALADIVSKVYPVKDITQFVSGGQANIEIVQKDDEYLRIEADAEVMERLDVDQTDGRVTLKLKDSGSGFFRLFGGNDAVKVTLHVNQLDYLELAGGAQASVSDLTGSELVIKASGAADVNFAKLTLDKVKVDVSGASDVSIKSAVVGEQFYEVSGASHIEIKNASSSELLNVNTSGASKFRGKKIIAKQADLKVSGASYASATVTETLRADASGASKIDYYGNPQTTNKATGASSINARTNN
ncbi:GIN domain-containing protein [Cellvibrio polysaccharolyticus]|uniref:DUF2807 domain-containing protein n=1 Tax=Cellvibrio polysaccharolyticus TaxID=2082724 RepID=A0A928YVA8_9GAMM|nr:DUF2807 domain-containing protein [Cellvibrio polysaccharolyticus]MBE8718842.1 DUF2807 domain-containing protein [Cellvibrio polysaccharolyticus]